MHMVQTMIATALDIQKNKIDVKVKKKSSGTEPVNFFLYLFNFAVKLVYLLRVEKTLIIK